MRKWLVLGVVSLLMAVIAIGVVGDQTVTKIMFVTGVPPAPHARGALTEEFMDLSSKLSGGRIAFDYYPAGQLYKEKDGLQALTAGEVQMMDPPNNYLTAYSILFELVELPIIFKDRSSFYRMLYGDLGAEILNSTSGSNIQGLSFIDEGPLVLATKKPIKTLDDFKGLKIRTAGHPLVEDLLKALGASTVRLPSSEVYTAAQQGLIDGVETTGGGGILGYHWEEVLPHVTLWPGRACYVFVANKAWWDNLDPFDRHVLESVANYVSLEFNQNIWNTEYPEIINEVRDRGGDFYELPSEVLEGMRAAETALIPQYREQFGDIIDRILEIAGQ